MDYFIGRKIELELGQTQDKAKASRKLLEFDKQYRRVLNGKDVPRQAFIPRLISVDGDFSFEEKNC